MDNENVIQQLLEQKIRLKSILEQIKFLNSNTDEINISKTLKSIKPVIDSNRHLLKLLLSSLEIEKNIPRRDFLDVKSRIIDNFAILQKISMNIDSLKWNDSDLSLTDAVTTSDENWYIMLLSIITSSFFRIPLISILVSSRV